MAPDFEVEEAAEAPAPLAEAEPDPEEAALVALEDDPEAEEDPEPDEVATKPEERPVWVDPATRAVRPRRKRYQLFYPHDKPKGC